MNRLSRLVEQLFPLPASGDAVSRRLLRQLAIAEHRQLTAAARAAPACAPLAAAARLLGHCHRLADPPSPALLGCVDPPRAGPDAGLAGRPRSSALGQTAGYYAFRGGPGRAALPSSARTRLGSVAVAATLLEMPAWQGRIGLVSDDFGLIRFPLSDWSIFLAAGSGSQQQVMRGKLIWAELGPRLCRFTLAGDEVAFLELSPAACRELACGGDGAELQDGGLHFPHPTLRPRLQRAHGLCGSGVRYEPACFLDFSGHAGLTGAILEALLQAIAQNSPGLFAEFQLHVPILRGLELAPVEAGWLGSFSQAWQPGIVGFNVNYHPCGAPLLHPLCFTWLAHELAHHRFYCIDRYVRLLGRRFLADADRLTPSLPRYGRPLRMGTLFQVPYVHLYEWWILMDFVEAEMAGLPWAVDQDPLAYGGEIAAEIEDSFDLLPRHARLTQLGQLALDRMRQLTQAAACRWRRLVGGPATRAAAPVARDRSRMAAAFGAPAKR